MRDQLSVSLGLALTILASTLSAGPAMPGGFAKQDPTRQEYQKVLGIAEKLLNEKYPGRDLRLGKLRSVYTQVVAGLNYKLLCAYRDRKGRGSIEIVVYRDLAGKFSILNESPARNDRMVKKRFQYLTSSGDVLSVELLPGDRIVLSYGKTRHILPRAVSASGARYSQDGLTFWMKGDEATWEDEKNNTRIFCRLK